MEPVAALALVSGLMVSGMTALCIIFAVHARGERKALMEMASAAYAHISAKDPREAVEALAIADYQKEALEQQRQNMNKNNGKSDQSGRFEDAVVRIAGEEYDIISGVD